METTASLFFDALRAMAATADTTIFPAFAVVADFGVGPILIDCMSTFIR
jgi:hypothetical protein